MTKEISESKLANQKTEKDIKKIKKNINFINSEILENKKKKKLLNILEEYKSVYYKKLEFLKIQKKVTFKKEEELNLLLENKIAKENLFKFLKENSDDIKCQRCERNYNLFVNKTEKDCFYHSGDKIDKFCQKCKNKGNYNCCNLCESCSKGCENTFHV